MRLAILIGSLAKGGSERVVVNLTDYLIGRGHEVTIITPVKNADEFTHNPSARRIMSDITKDETTSSRVRNFYRRAAKLRGIWKETRPDLILSFIGKNNCMAVLTSRFLPVKVAVAVRGDPRIEYKDRFLRLAARFCYHLADGVIWQNESDSAFFGKSIQRKSVVLRNPASAKFFRPRFAGEREKTVVASGYFCNPKNHKLLIRAFASVAAKYPDYQLIIYGDGVRRADLEKEVLTLGLSDRVSLPGFSDCLEEDLYRASIYVLSSNTEGLPNSLIEAMLLGLACISTDCPSQGPASLIRHGENGLLTPCGDAEKLADNLRLLMSDPGLIERLGESAHELQEDFAMEKTGAAWEEYLESKL